MRTVKALQAMTPTQRVDEFEALCAVVFPDMSQRYISNALGGYTRKALHDWRTKPAVPISALLLLQEWALRGSHTPPRPFEEQRKSPAL